MLRIVPNPVGIDLPISRIQKSLHDKLGIPSINAFGRVYRNTREEGKEVLEAYDSNNEYIDPFTDDSYNLTFFFMETGQPETINGIIFNTEIEIVFMGNLEALFQSRDKRFDLELQDRVMQILVMESSFKVRGIVKEFTEIFKEYDYSTLITENMNPYHVFSVKGTVRHGLRCLTN